MSCEIPDIPEFEFFQGGAPSLKFRLRSATLDATRGILIPGDYISLENSTIQVKIAAGSVVFIDREATPDADQVTNKGKAVFDFLPGDTEDLTDTTRAKCQIKMIPQSGIPVFFTGPNLLIKEVFN